MPEENQGCLTTLLRVFGLNRRYSRSQQPDDLPYRLNDNFLSTAELSFYRVLASMVGEKYVIFPKVSLAELFFVTDQEGFRTYQNKIDRKRMDFLLCDAKTLKPALAIELDDSSHMRQDRIERDEFVNQVCEAAGLALVHVQARLSYDINALAETFRKAIDGNADAKISPEPADQGSTPPLCPKCGIPMVLRTARRGNTPGQQFYGCTNYPRCKEVIPLKKG